jgi:hypothetical protein
MATPRNYDTIIATSLAAPTKDQLNKIEDSPTIKKHRMYSLAKSGWISQHEWWFRVFISLWNENSSVSSSVEQFWRKSPSLVRSKNIFALPFPTSTLHGVFSRYEKLIKTIFSFERREAFITDGIGRRIQGPTILVASMLGILVPKVWEEKDNEMYVSELEAANSLRFGDWSGPRKNSLFALLLPGHKGTNHVIL